MFGILKEWAAKYSCTIIESPSNMAADGSNIQRVITETRIDDKNGYEMTSYLKETGRKDVVLQIQTTLDRKGSIKFIFSEVLLMVSVLAFGLSFCSLPLNPKNVSGWNVLALLISYIPMGFIFIRRVTKNRTNKREIRKLENSLEDEIGTKADYQIISGVEPVIYKRKFYLISLLIFFFGFLILLSEMNLLAASLFVVWFLIFKVPEVVNKFAKDRPQIFWKTFIVGNINKISLFSWSILLLVFALLALNSIIIKWNQYEFKKNARYSELFEIDFEKDIYERDLRRISHDNVTMLRIFPFMDETTSLGILVVFGLSVLLIQITAYYDLGNGVKEWRDVIGQDTESFTPPPLCSVDDESEKDMNFLVLINFVGLAIGNIMGLLGAIELISYELIGSGLISKYSGVILSWMHTYCFLYRKSPVNHLLTAFILVITLPVFVISIYCITRIVRMLYCEVFGQQLESVKSSLKEDTIEFIKIVCDKHKLREPRLLLRKGSGINVSANGRIFSGRASILISEGAFQFLDNEELKAAIAHEIGHIKRGVRSLEIYKFLCAVMLVPNPYLSIVLKPSKLEFDADEFAVKATAGKDALSGALLKTSVHNMFRRGDKGNLLEKRFKIIREIKNFYFGDKLLGYAHPPLMLRLERIKKLETAYQT